MASDQAGAGTNGSGALAVRQSHILWLLRALVTEPGESGEQDAQQAAEEGLEPLREAAACELWDLSADADAASYAVANKLPEVLALALVAGPGTQHRILPHMAPHR